MFIKMPAVCLYFLAVVMCVSYLFNPFSTAVSFWGQYRIIYLEFEWFVPTTGLKF